MRHITDIKTVIADLTAKGVCIGQVKPKHYHAWKKELEEELNCPVVSKSTLAAFSANPYRFNWERENEVEKVTPAMSLGSLVDTIALTPDLFDELYKVEEKRVALKKDGTPYANGMQDPDQKIAWQCLAEAGIQVISTEQCDEASRIADVVTEKLASHGWHIGDNCHTQVAIWARLTRVDDIALATPVILCGMLDITDLRSTIIDLKTTSVDVANFTKLTYLMEDFRYGMQAAIYRDLLAMAAVGSDILFDFLFVGTAEPHQVRTIRMTEEALMLYAREYKHALLKYAACWRLEEWGESDLGITYYSPSAREYNLIDERARA